MSSPGPTHRGAVTFITRALQTQLLTLGYFEIQNLHFVTHFGSSAFLPYQSVLPSPGPAGKAELPGVAVTPSNCYQVGMVWLLQRTGRMGGAAAAGLEGLW